MTYKYKLLCFVKGEKVYEENKEITNADLYALSGSISDLSFYRLLDKWNKNGLVPANENAGRVYLYTSRD